MIVKKFLREKLAHLAEAFPHVTVKYKYNELAEAHIIELSPVEEYYNNKTLDDAWMNITMSFWEKFPAELIGFISSDCTLKIENPEFAFNLENNLQIAIQD